MPPCLAALFEAESEDRVWPLGTKLLPCALLWGEGCCPLECSPGQNWEVPSIRAAMSSWVPSDRQGQVIFISHLETRTRKELMHLHGAEPSAVAQCQAASE